MSETNFRMFYVLPSVKLICSWQLIDRIFDEEAVQKFSDKIVEELKNMNTLTEGDMAGLYGYMKKISAYQRAYLWQQFNQKNKPLSEEFYRIPAVTRMLVACFHSADGLRLLYEEEKEVKIASFKRMSPTYEKMYDQHISGEKRKEVRTLTLPE